MKNLSYLNKYILRYKWHFLTGTLFVAISVVFGIYPAQYIRLSFNEVEKVIHLYRSGAAVDYHLLSNTLLWYAIVIIGSSILKGAFTFFMRQTIIVASRRIEYDLKNEIYQHYQKLHLAFYRKNSTGDLMNRISEDVSRVRMYIGPAVMYGINVLVTLAIVIPIMFSISAKLTLYVLLPLPVLSYVIYHVSQLINVRSEVVQRKLSDLSTLAQETFSGIRVIKAFSKENFFAHLFAEASDEYSRVNEKLYKVNAMFMPLVMFLIGLSTLLTVYVGGMETLAGRLTTGNIAEFILYLNMLTWPVTSIGWVTSIIQRAEASQMRINEFLHTEPEIVNPTEKPFEFKGKIEFQNVTMVYPDSGVKALDNVSFTIEPGTTVGLVGKTGSGKSTVAALMLRQYDPTNGRILIDGHDLRTINLEDYRKNLGVVPQDGYLFSDTIYNNIAFGLDHPKDQVIYSSAEIADLDANIRDFPQGYQTRVGERGITLSGGQKQRTALARAIARRPMMYILDDCLSAVDTETEDRILRNIRQLTAQATTLIISHRISSIKDADKIIVLDHGRVVEQGTHQQLIDAGGYYAHMYQQQVQSAAQPVDLE
ncbi:ABC transporter [Thermaurantimonas aggregans]|uniref:ABC transporter n=1 Tax=Thermaurantimonas aggregans TaxID=2173829 RepID=A0A401XLU7_9FLAO|nr:ABC transporter ATP-binding protein [Thermaurantimonas aggregans]MCX8149544.1 ABC transporter ATP-binding protein/permease [Thermaurantimonas aggregans]GCD77980.1 ABC transporter [Thermaurantimonas aggregans]